MHRRLGGPLKKETDPELEAMRAERRRVVDEYTKQLNAHQPPPLTPADAHASRAYAEMIADELGYSAPA